MALVVRQTQSRLLGDIDSYVLEHCLLVPLQYDAISAADVWDAQLALSRCDIALV
jgi:hypothetical protein